MSILSTHQRLFENGYARARNASLARHAREARQNLELTFNVDHGSPVTQDSRSYRIFLVIGHHDSTPRSIGSPIGDKSWMKSVPQSRKRAPSGAVQNPELWDDSNAETSSTMTATSVSSSMSVQHTASADSADSLNMTQHESRQTYVEVCVRVRPLFVSSTPQRYFDSNKQQANSPRRPSRMVRPSSSKLPPRTPIIGSTSPRRKASLPSFNGDSDALAAAKNSFSLNTNSTVAWEVVPEEEATTVQQHPDTVIPGRTHSYTLDRVYGPSSTTLEMYQASVLPLVESTVLEGYHSSVFCYGQTSTGKTFTMTGTKQSPGLLPLAVQDVFRLCHQHQEGHSDREYLLRVRYVEIYNEQVIDLLSPNSTTVIRILEHPTEGVVVRGLREDVVSTPEQVFALLRSGEARRQVGSTNLNKHSSRSHAIFRLTVESSRCGATRQCSAVRVSSLSLVDLAGSESVRLSGATGDRRKEGQYINKSLMTLGQVVYKLAERKRQQEGSSSSIRGPRHIPYRDSKLTRLLQPSLSGNAQIVMICNISPQLDHMEESHNTLKFALRAKRIEQNARVTEVSDDKTLLQSYREEIAELKMQLEVAREAQRRLEEQTSQRTTGIDDDTNEIEEAIAKMERLILKATSPTVSPRVGSPAAVDDDDDELLNTLSGDAVENEAPVTPARARPQDDRHLVKELHRIQGLLGSALTKRRIFASSPERDEEIEVLRAQLHENDVARSLRKADSSFLENQLIEKDGLLAEVSKILEAMEKRQADLEAENKSLRDRLLRANTDMASERHEKELLKVQLDRVEKTMGDREAQRVTNGTAYHP